MSFGFEVGGGDELSILPHLWQDGNADWGFDFDEQDWALWDALGGDGATNPLGEPSAPAFHTPSSPPPPPPTRLLSPAPPRRHAPSLRVNEAMLTQPSRRPIAANATSHTPPTQPTRSSRNEHRSVPRRRREPTPAHRQDSRYRSANRPSNTLSDLTQNVFTPLGATSPSFDSAEFDDSVDIDDILTNVDTESEAENMPPNTRRRWNGDSVVDLTIDSSPPSEATSQRHQPKRKRTAQEPAQAQSSKRRKGAYRLPKAEDEGEIEQLDLTNEAPSAEEELAQAQTAAAVLAQQAAASAAGPLKIGQRQCIICMENFTNITITACGHVYCHECLTQALLAGEKNSDSGKANCPVCRKQVSRKAKNQVIPLQFMKRSAFNGKARSGMSVLG